MAYSYKKKLSIKTSSLITVKKKTQTHITVYNIFLLQIVSEWITLEIKLLLEIKLIIKQACTINIMFVIITITMQPVK